jgi:hypothetical protein
MTDERREQIEAYGIDPDSAEGFRERLAYGAAPVLAEHAEPQKIEPVRVAGLDGQWIEL